MASKPTSSMKTSLMMLKCWNRRKALSIICILAMLVWYQGYSAFIATSQDSILSMHIERRNELTELELYKMKTNFHCEVHKVGCFQSKKLNVETTLSLTEFNYMTHNWCLSLCSSRSANYAGLKSGDTCICGQEVTQFAELQYTNCSTRCRGGTGTCGGGDAVQVFRIVSPCFQGHEVSTTIEKSNFLGCFFPSSSSEEEDYSYRKNLSHLDCILFCNMQMLSLATLNDKNACKCGQFNERFNLKNKINCTERHVKVYRTFSEDARCDNIRFLPSANYSQAILATFPGSGNTWTRYLLERATGIYTGSVYGDKRLYKTGFLAEPPEISKVRSVVVKDHMLANNTMSSYQSAILIIRNPYDAMIADFNRFASDGDHTAVVSEKRFQSKEFDDHFKRISHVWINLIKNVVTSGKPFIIIEFGELVNDPIATTLKMVEFLQKHTVISPDHLQQRILCLSQQLNGEHKRKKRKLTIDPFTKVMKQKVNHDVGEARKLLNERSVDFLLPKYEREVLQELV
ncbi:sialate:O-sulfotransferase 1-like [Clavelina lepadiformis]|uniref:sialate:O-sulfotransferase 1-like n=1 Tax=Clavelina lepadiformis TaxID=159417 RepID=UPI0040428551